MLIEKHGTADHGDEESAGFPPHEGFEHAGPRCLAVGFGQRIVGEGFVCPAGAGFGRAAEDAVEHEKPEHPRTPRGEGEDGHFRNHEPGGEDHDTFASDHVGQGAGRNFQHDDDHGPDDIEQRVLLEGESEIEEENADDRVVKPRVEEHAEGDEEGEVALE